MPAVGAAIVSAIVGIASAVGTFFTTIFGSNLLLIGLSIGLNLLSLLLFRPKQPKPEDVQSILKNPVAPRMRSYGRVKIAGVLVFVESSGSRLHKVLAINTGRIDAVEALFVDDVPITPVVQGSFDEGHKEGAVYWRLGLSTETYYNVLAGYFSEWTTAHRGDGVASVYFFARSPKDPKYFANDWPQGSGVTMHTVFRGVLVYNWATGTTIWSDNAADVIADYMQHQEGMRLSASMFTTPQATAGWLAAHNRCAEQVALLAGGTEDRYRLWGTYQLDERPADVLGRMLLCCDGRIVPTADGGVTLDIGAWAEPTVTLDTDTITGFAEVSRGRDIMTGANVITSTYTSVEHKYQATDATPWRDEPDILIRGEIIKDQAFNMSPSHGQTRRLMKLEAWRANPGWIGTFQCNLRGLAAFGERLIRVTYPAFEIDEVFEVLDFRFNIGEGQILTGVTIQVQSMPVAAYTWDAEQEESSPPVSESPDVDRTIPVPTGLNFTYERIQVGTTLLPVGIITADTPPDNLRLEGQYKKTSEGATAWQIVTFGEDAVTAKTGILEDGTEYEAQVRHITPTGRPGAWTASDTLTPTADPTAPGQVTNVSAVGGTGDTVDLSWTNPNSANFSAVRIYRNTADNQGTATLVHTEYGAPNGNDSWLDSGRADGSYWYWLAAINGSGVAATAVATGEVIVL